MGAMDEVSKLFEDFKSANDQRLEQIEKSATKAADGLVTEKVEKLNAAIQEAMDKANAESAEARKAAEQAQLAVRRVMGEVGVERPTVKAADLARFKRATGNADAGAEEYLATKAAVDQYLRRGEKGITRDQEELLQKAMSTDSDPDGGYSVMPDTSGRIVQFVFDTSPIRQIAAVQTISSDALEGYNDLDEAGSGWVSERGSRPETDTPELGRYRIQAHELYAEPRATQRLLDDSELDVEGWLATKVSDKFARDEATAFVTGDGVGKPRGFLTYPAGTPSASSWGVIERQLSGANGAFDAAPDGGDALVDLVYKLKSAYRQNARFVMNRLTMAAVRKLKDSDGAYIWAPGITQSGLGMLLLGHQVVEAEDMPDYSDTGALGIAFGDFSRAYQIVDRVGIRVLRDPFTSKGFVKFYTTKRVGGDVINFDAIKLMEFSAP